MHDELTAQDIEQMRAELRQRKTVLLPQLIEAVQEARAFGDLSENFEYKAAKQELNACKRRIRYLEGMISSARVISDHSSDDEVGLFDKVTVRIPSMGDREMVYQLVTTMRADALKGRITRESPVGKALAGRHAGETIHVQVNPEFGYDLVIVSIEKQADDGSIQINAF